jgi:hypothetical protein
MKQITITQALKKEDTLKIRISKEDKALYQSYCAKNNTTPSEDLRGYIDFIIIQRIKRNENT